MIPSRFEWFEILKNPRFVTLMRSVDTLIFHVEVDEYWIVTGNPCEKLHEIEQLHLI